MDVDWTYGCGGDVTVQVGQLSVELSLDVQSSQVIGDGVKPTRGHQEDPGLSRCLRILLSHLLHELEEEDDIISSVFSGFTQCSLLPQQLEIVG